jgi:redox-sensitive bicupin YhaK (pirin superfamily)
LYTTILGPREGTTLALDAGRHAWIQVARGAIAVNGHPLRQGDGASASAESSIAMNGVETAEVLLFDLG